MLDNSVGTIYRYITDANRIRTVVEKIEGIPCYQEPSGAESIVAVGAPAGQCFSLYFDPSFETPRQLQRGDLYVDQRGRSFAVAGVLEFDGEYTEAVCLKEEPSSFT